MGSETAARAKRRVTIGDDDLLANESGFSGTHILFASTFTCQDYRIVLASPVPFLWVMALSSDHLHTCTSGHQFSGSNAISSPVLLWSSDPLRAVHIAALLPD